ncbi:DUF6350 family protein [Aeromicrobium sp.]|uniref:cell division protein PerM n=1 Tax=Aeromicrobium sp. TaxID=1871063 RepID=UPI0030BE62F8
MPPPVETPYLRPAFLTALLAAVLSLAVSAVFVVIARGFADFTLASLLRSTVRTWLVALGSGIDAGGVTFALVPIGATLVCVALVACTAAWVVTEPVQELAAFTATTAGAYGVIAGIASAASASGDVHTPVVRAAFVAFVVGGIGAALGAVRRHGGGDQLWFTASEDVRLATRAAVPGVLVVLTAAGVVVVVQLARNISRAGDLWAQLDPGRGGGIALGVGCLLAAPTLLLWTASVLIGPGFMLGTDTSVDLSGSQLGNVPGFPLLAALPPPGELPGWVFVLGLVPLLAGVVSGWRVGPGRREGVLGRVALGAAAGAVAGFMLGVLIGLSGGAVGPGRMADAGPPTFTPLLLAVPVMAVGGALGAALAHYRGDRASQSPDTSSTGRPRLWKRHQSPGADRRVDES